MIEYTFFNSEVLLPSHPKTTDSYNKYAKKYDDHVSDPEDSVFHSYYEKPAIRAALPKLDGLNVISIGCGSGIDARWLQNNGAENVVGIDNSESMIQLAKNNHKGIKFQVMDMEQLDFDDERFDLAYSSLALHYLDDWVKSLREAYRILKSGGSYIFSCGHPIDTAMEYFDEQTERGAILGRTIKKDSDERTIHGDYLATDSDGVKAIDVTLGTTSGTASISPMKVRIYHRTMSKMVEQISASGFTIERLIEPQPVDKMKINHKSHYEQLRKIPFFMIWVLRKQNR